MRCPYYGGNRTVIYTEYTAESMVLEVEEAGGPWAGEGEGDARVPHHLNDLGELDQT